MSVHRIGKTTPQLMTLERGRSIGFATHHAASRSRRAFRRARSESTSNSRLASDHRHRADRVVLAVDEMIATAIGQEQLQFDAELGM
jgi:hypothetical protein